MSKSDLRGRVAVVTGAGAGVGRAVVRELARQGAWVGLLGRNEERLAAARREVEAAGGRAFAVKTDVADAGQVEQAAEQVERELGPIDIWINNAMTTIFAPIDKIKPEEFKRATEVTYLGTVYGTMSALKRMTKRNAGTIVQVGSALAYRSIPLQAPYCGAKHAMVGFTDSVRSELEHNKSNVHLTAVHLPAVNTPQFSWGRTRLPRHPQPVPPIFAPEVVAEAIVWAAAHQRREVWVGTPTYKAIWGQRIAPEFADWYLAKTAYQGQQTGEEISPDRPDNLFEPVGGTEFAAEGVFGNQSQRWTITNKLDLNPIGAGWLVAIGLAISGLAAWRGTRRS